MRVRLAVLLALFVSLVALGGQQWRHQREITAEDERSITQAARRLGTPILVDDPTLTVFLREAEDTQSDSSRAAVADSLRKEFEPIASTFGYILTIRGAGPNTLLSDLGATSYALPREGSLRFLVIAPGRPPATTRRSLSPQDLAGWLRQYQDADQPRVWRQGAPDELALHR
jgi:hypothetical protein